jgi:hypothetical protein
MLFTKITHTLFSQWAQIFVAVFLVSSHRLESEREREREAVALPNKSIEECLSTGVLFGASSICYGA